MATLEINAIITTTLLPTFYNSLRDQHRLTLDSLRSYSQFPGYIFWLNHPILQLYLGDRVTVKQISILWPRGNSSHREGEHYLSLGWKDTPKLATTKRLLRMNFSSPSYSSNDKLACIQQELMNEFGYFFKIRRCSKFIGCPKYEILKSSKLISIAFQVPDLTSQCQQCMLQNNINSEWTTNPAVHWNMKSIYVKRCFTEFET